MSNTFCVASNGNIGATFLEWSLQWLQGATQYYSLNQGRWIDLVDNPTTSHNAHGHRKNHPVGAIETLACIQRLGSIKHGQSHSFYPYPLFLDSCARNLGLRYENVDESMMTQLRQHQSDDYHQVLTHCEQHSVPVIYLGVNLDGRPDFSFARTLTYQPGFYLSRPDSAQAVTDYHDEVFFKHDRHRWGDSPEIWDDRERRALSIRPFQIGLPKPPMDFSHVWFSGDQLLLEGEHVIRECMCYLDLPLNDSRWPAWVLAYHDWQRMRGKSLRFEHTYQHIVDCIVNGWAYEIDLSFDQEVVILHFLIYQHNLSLRSWQLSQFPKNTKQLHDLLEPNIHPLAFRY